MGLAASQARLLFLTSRLSDLELRSQVISNAKIRLAEESSTASDQYTSALDKQKFQFQNGANSDGPTYIPATVANLTTYNPAYGVSNKPRRIEDASGRVLVSEKTAKTYEDAQSGKLPSSGLSVAMGDFVNGELKKYGKNSPTDIPSFANDEAAFISEQAPLFAKDSFIQTMGGGSTDSKATDDYSSLYDQMQSGYTVISDDNMNSSAWLESQVSAGNIFLYEQQTQADGTTPFVNISWTSGDPDIQEVDDSTETAKAEAKYEATMADIQSKDERFDLQLKNIDTEHEATQTEVDSVKKVIDKNIERAFKMFQA